MKLVKAVYDMLINLFGSRKGWVFLTATGMRMFGQLDNVSWLIVSLAFISTVLLEKLIEKLPKGV